MNKHTIILLSFLLINIQTFAQKQIAITIDDPTSKVTPLLNWKERDRLLIKTLQQHKIKAALFVCGMRVDDSKGKQILNNWDANNHLICNHTFNHMYYNSETIDAAFYIADFLKADTFISKYKNYT